MAWTAIANGSIDQDSPVTQPLMTAYRDNQIMAVQMGWAPWDIDQPSDTTAGPIYDWAVSGSVALIETPTFADDYEYRIIADAITVSIGGGGTGELTVSLYGATDGYSSPMTVTPTDSLLWMMVEIPMPRMSTRVHFVGQTAVTFGSAQKVSKAKIATAVAGTITGGTVWLQRRRVIV
jgi:hypothetical protein